jgi:hypothetical protein
MDTPVGEHIRRLEDRLLELNVQFMENNRDLTDRNRIEADIRAAHNGHRSLPSRTQSRAQTDSECGELKGQHQKPELRSLRQQLGLSL